MSFGLLKMTLRAKTRRDMNLRFYVVKALKSLGKQELSLIFLSAAFNTHAILSTKILSPVRCRSVVLCQIP